MGQCCRRSSGQNLREEAPEDEEVWTRTMTGAEQALRDETPVDEGVWTRPMTAAERRSTKSTCSVTEEVLAGVAANRRSPRAGGPRLRPSCAVDSSALFPNSGGMLWWVWCGANAE